MIICPKCTKEIADDSAHCGYCGQEIKAKVEKKTMFGMAALDGAVLQKAIKEAQAAKDEAQASAQGLKLPKPATGASGGGAPASAGGSGLKLPKPGEASAGGGDAFDDLDDDDLGLAKTEMLEFSEEARAELREAAATVNLAAPAAGSQDEPEFSDEDANAPTMPHTQPDFNEAPAGAGFGSQQGGLGAQNGFGSQGGFGSEDDFDSEDVLGSQDDFGGPVEFGQSPSGQPVGGFGQQSKFDQPASQGPIGGFGSPQADSLPVTTDGEPAKSKKGLYIAIAAVVFVLGSGCFLSLMWWAYSTLVAG